MSDDRYVVRKIMCIDLSLFVNFSRCVTVHPYRHVIVFFSVFTKVIVLCALRFLNFCRHFLSVF